jgi:DNA repair protein RecO (recombination protein O)
MRAGLISTDALLLRRTEYRDSDLLLTFFTASLGKITVLARGARNSRRRFLGALEPMHGLSLEISGTEQRYALEGASIASLRGHLTRSLTRMNAAARALSWVRDTTPECQPDPGVWHLLQTLLDALDASDEPDTVSLLAAAGLQLLDILGWAVELECCVSCGRNCPAAKAAMLDPARGGLMCGGCGGAKLLVSGPQRAALQRLAGDLFARVDPPLAALALRVTDAALAAHADVKPQ